MSEWIKEYLAIACPFFVLLAFLLAINSYRPLNKKEETTIKNE